MLKIPRGETFKPRPRPPTYKNIIKCGKTLDREAGVEQTQRRRSQAQSEGRPTTRAQSVEIFWKSDCPSLKASISECRKNNNTPYIVAFGWGIGIIFIYIFWTSIKGRL